jgi:hypothetical protein
MFNITKLTAASQSFIREISSNGLSRSVMASIAISKVLADACSMPSAPVESIGSYFNTSNAIALGGLLSDVNELVLLDRDAVLAYVQAWYQYRYHAMYPAPVTIALRADHAIQDFFGISRSFDQASLDVIATSCIQITDYTAKFKALVEDLKGVDHEL